jgi:hypothetical protein
LDGGVNLYSYAEANPVVLVDPEGLKAQIACANIGFGPFSWTPFVHCRIRVTCDDCSKGGPYDTSFGLERNRRSSRKELAVTEEALSGAYTHFYDIGGVDQNDSCEFGNCLMRRVEQYKPKAASWTPQYRMRGPNSNSFAGHIMRACGGSGPPMGPFGATGFNQPLGFK